MQLRMRGTAALLALTTAGVLVVTVATVARTSAANVTYISLAPAKMTASGGLVALSTNPPKGTTTCTFHSPEHSIEIQLPRGTTNSCEIQSPRSLAVPVNTSISNEKYSVTEYFASTLVKNLKPKSATAIFSVEPSAPLTYVAIGDSYAAGQGNLKAGWVNHSGDIGDATAKDGCNRSSIAYPMRVSMWLKGQSSFPTALSAGVALLHCVQRSNDERPVGLWRDQRQIGGEVWRSQRGVAAIGLDRTRPCQSGHSHHRRQRPQFCRRH